MVLQLEDFKEETLSLQDFEGPEADRVKVNEKSASMLAATDSALTGPSIEQYRQTRESLLDPQTRERYLQRQVMMREALLKDSVQAAPGMIGDASLSDESRMAALNSLALGTEHLKNEQAASSLNMLAEEAAIASSDVNETEQGSKSRMRAIDIIGSVNQSKIDTQKAINAYRETLPNSVAGAIVDVGEVMVPMAEWIHIDRLLKDVQGGADIGALGQQRQKIFDYIRGLPIEKRAAYTERFIELVKEHENIILPDGNDLVSVDTLERSLLDNDYSDFERWFDNATSVLDLIGIGGAVRALGRGSRVAGVVEDAGAAVRADDADFVFPSDRTQAAPENAEKLEGMIIEGEYEDVTDRAVNARKRATHSDVALTSPSQIVKDVNPEQARIMHGMVANDGTDEMAEGLYGTSRSEALAKDLLPEPNINGNIPNKVSQEGPSTKEPPQLREARNRDGNSYLSEVEVKRVEENLVDGLENIEGMKLHKESLVVQTADDGTFTMKGRYSPRDNGFSSPAEALSNAKFAFRNYRLEDEDFSVMARIGDEWVEIDPGQADAMEVLRAEFEARDLPIPSNMAVVDYAVGLDTNYRFRPEDLTEWEVLSVKRNLLDRIPAKGVSLAKAGQGSLTQNLLDAASVLHPQIVNPTSVAVDRSFHLKNLYIETFEDFSKNYSALPKDRRAKMTDYIHEANFDGIPFREDDLINRGFNDAERDVLREWRRANDAMWYASNSDMANTLRNQGNRIFVHNDSNTLLVGRPVPRNTVNQGAVAFDPVSDGITSVDDLDQLYETGGELMRLSSPTSIDGFWTDLVVVRNTPEGGYSRVIRDNDKVLSYRDGYYPVMYDARWFVTMQVKTPDGRTVNKVVASARDTEERNRALEQLRQAHPDAVFDARQDRRREQARSNTFDENAYQLATSSGLSAQRVRGERLKDAGVDLHKAGYSNLADPLEAVGAQVNQLSQKVSMRPVLDAMRARWMSNYGRHLNLPTNPHTGQPDFPKNIGEVNGRAETPGKMVADARSMFNYIYSMENGYINWIDEGYRTVLQAGANFLGESGLVKAERVLENASDFSPNGAAKSAAFKLLLAGNPVRQAIIQRAQILTLTPVNPKYVTTGLAADLIEINRARLGLNPTERGQRLWQDVQDAGILEAIRGHDFIREDMLRLADLSAAQKARSAAAAPLNFSQKIGFEAAEEDLLMTSWLVFREKARAEGKNLNSQRVQDQILGDTRAYTLNMNRAGDLPYSRNTLGLATQFFSVQHKALLQGFTNRSLSPKERAKVLAYTTALFGAESTLLIAAVNAAFGEGPPNEIKDTIKDGLLDYTFNKALTLASGEDQMIDWGT